MATTINFNDRFKKGANQAYIAVSGDKEQIIEKLERVIEDIKKYGKPIQENMSGYKIECQIITPVWNGLSY